MEGKQQMENSNEKPNKKDLMKMRIRAGIYPLAGVYLIYLAHCMYRDLSVTSGNRQIFMSIFSVLFFGAGLGMLLLGIRITYKNSKRTPGSHEEPMYIS